MRNAECAPARWSGYPLSARGFTLIEIAISLAVIGFALVAIIGILPSAMQVQKQNRQETIINQDATVFLDAIRNGAQGLDDLTNYIVAITNSVTQYSINGTATARHGYTYTESTTSPKLYLTNGLRIVGLLSTPKIIALPSPNGRSAAFLSNHVVAYVRSLSGNASEKAPAAYKVGQNPVQDLAFDLGFSYRMIPELVSYSGYDTNSVWTNQPGISANERLDRVSNLKLMANLQTNLHDLRLTFRWPLLPSGDAGPGRQVFRAAATGQLTWTNQFLGQAGSWPQMSTAPGDLATTLFFFQPRTYLQVQIP